MSRIQDFDVNSRIKGSDGAAVERSNGRSARGVDRVRSGTAAPPAAAATGSATDSVEVSASARTLLTLQQSLAEVPDVDVQKVERIRLAIDNQTYRIDTARVADRLMQMDGDLAAASSARKY